MQQPVNINFPRARAWCVAKDAKGVEHVGIVHEWPQVTRDRATGTVIRTDPTLAEVHTVTENGETLAEIRDVAIADIRQATLAEIPPARRPSAEDAAELGLDYHPGA